MTWSQRCRTRASPTRRCEFTGGSTGSGSSAVKLLRPRPGRRPLTARHDAASYPISTQRGNHGNHAVTCVTQDSQPPHTAPARRSAGWRPRRVGPAFPDQATVLQHVGYRCDGASCRSKLLGLGSKRHRRAIGGVDVSLMSISERRRSFLRNETTQRAPSRGV